MLNLSKRNGIEEPFWLASLKLAAVSLFKLKIFK